MIGIFNYLYIYIGQIDFVHVFFVSEFPDSRDPSRSAFLIGSAFLIFQIYNIDKEYFKRLIDTFIVLAFTLSMIYPTFCVLGVFIFSSSYIYFIIIHFLIIGALLYDKNK